MSETGRLVTEDHFSHTIHGQSVLNQPWLAQWIMYRLHEFGGYSLNQFAAGAGYGLGLFCVTWLAWKRCANSMIAGLLGVLALTAMATNVGVRPQWFSVVLFAAELIWLVQVRRAWLAALGVFAIVAMWTNLHGAYPLGVVVPALMAVSSLAATDRSQKWIRFQRYVAATAAAGVATFVRPDPENTIAYVTGVGSSSVARGLEEWLPPALDRNVGVLFFVAIAATFVLLGTSRRRLSLEELLLLSVFFVPAVGSQRMIIWWGLLLPLVLAKSARSAGKYFDRTPAYAAELSEAVQPRQRRKPTASNRRFEWAMAIAFLAFLSISTPWTRGENPLLPTAKRHSCPAEEPRELVNWSTSGTNNEIRSFTSLRWAPYLTWYSRGRIQSFIDSRVDIFPDAIWSDYESIVGGGNKALELLDRYGIEMVVCDAQLARLSKTLRDHAGWHVEYENSIGQSFRRKLGQTAAVVRPE